MKRKVLFLLRNWWGALVMFPGTGLAIGLGFTFRDFFNKNAGTALVVATMVLVLVTALYAWHTWQIAKATRKQAEASLDLARQAERQMHQGFRPILRFSCSCSLPEIEFQVESLGVGPALNVGCWLEVHFLDEHPKYYTTTANGESFFIPVVGVKQIGGSGGYSPKLGQNLYSPWKVKITETVTNVSKVSLVAVYKDIFGNIFASKSTSNKVREALGLFDLAVYDKLAENDKCRWEEIVRGKA